jgi:hypothetical protein
MCSGNSSSSGFPYNNLSTRYQGGFGCPSRHIRHHITRQSIMPVSNKTGIAVDHPAMAAKDASTQKPQQLLRLPGQLQLQVSWGCWQIRPAVGCGGLTRLWWPPCFVMCVLHCLTSFTTSGRLQTCYRLAQLAVHTGQALVITLV